jgi:hypothetical protein
MSSALVAQLKLQSDNTRAYNKALDFVKAHPLPPINTTHTITAKDIIISSIQDKWIPEAPNNTTENSPEALPTTQSFPPRTSESVVPPHDTRPKNQGNDENTVTPRAGQNKY